MLINQLLTLFRQRDAHRNGRNKRRSLVKALRRKTPLGAEALEARHLMTAGAVNSYQQTNLISDQVGVAAIQDTNLTNARGLAIPTGGDFWVADSASGVASVYSGDVHQSALTKAQADISIPGGDVTGVVSNPTGAFTIYDGNGHSAPATFLFATEDGRIAGWNAALPPPAPSATAETGTTVIGAVYTGITIAYDLIYAANFHKGTIDIFDSDFTPVTVSGHFADPKIPAGYAPFNIQNIGGELFVTYAKQDVAKHDPVTGAGKGFVDVFNSDGNLLTRLAGGTSLNAPWGVVQAPVNFGPFGGDILVGNLGDGHIHVFDPSNGALLGALHDTSGNVLTINGLWGLAFGNGSTAGDVNSLYFTAGPDGESHGLFGKLAAAPEVLNRVSITGQTVSRLKTAGYFSDTLRISNKSGTTVSGNINLVFTNLPPGVTILDASGKTADGNPFVTIPTSIRGHHSIFIHIVFSGSWSIMPITKYALRHSTALLGDMT